MAVSLAKLSSSGTIDTGNKTGHITNQKLNEKRKELKTTFLSRSVFYELDGKGGLDAEVVGYAGPPQRGTKKEGPPWQPRRCRFLLFFLSWACRSTRGMEGRSWGGVASSSKPFRCFWGPVDGECRWGCDAGVRVRLKERKGELGSALFVCWHKRGSVRHWTPQED